MDGHDHDPGVAFGEDHYRTLVQSIDIGLCTIEVLFDDDGRPVDYRFLDLNPAFAELTGLHQAAGRRMRDLAPTHEEHWFQIYGEIARTRIPRRFEQEAAS